MKLVDDLESQLREHYERPDPGEANAAHPDDLELSAYLEGRLSPEAQEVLEGHLAICTECRQLARCSAAAVSASESPETSQPPPEAPVRPPSGFSRSWKVAALLALTLGGLLLFRSQDEVRLRGLETLGVSKSALAGRPAEEIAELRRAADGRWPKNRHFEALLLEAPSPNPDAVLRSASSLRSPVPLEPRWSGTLSPTPRFRWLGRSSGAEAEVVLVDEGERLVLSLPIASRVGSSPPAEVPGLESLPFPADTPPLLPGGTYFWKINTRLDGEWIASEYVPFRVLTPDQAAGLHGSLAADEGAPFLRAMSFARYGLWREAAIAVIGLAPEVDRDHLYPLVESLLGETHLPQEVLETQAQGLLEEPLVEPEVLR